MNGVFIESRIAIIGDIRYSLVVWSWKSN